MDFTWQLAGLPPAVHLVPLGPQSPTLGQRQTPLCKGLGWFTPSLLRADTQGQVTKPLWDYHRCIRSPVGPTALRRSPLL